MRARSARRACAPARRRRATAGPPGPARPAARGRREHDHGGRGVRGRRRLELGVRLDAALDQPDRRGIGHGQERTPGLRAGHDRAPRAARGLRLGQAQPRRLGAVERRAPVRAPARLAQPPLRVDVGEVHDEGNRGVDGERVLEHARRRGEDQVEAGRVDAIGEPRGQRGRAEVRQRARAAGGDAERRGEAAPAARRHRELEVRELRAERGDGAARIRLVGREGQREVVLPREATGEPQLAGGVARAARNGKPSAEHEDVHGRPLTARERMARWPRVCAQNRRVDPHGEVEIRIPSQPLRADSGSGWARPAS